MEKPQKIRLFYVEGSHQRGIVIITNIQRVLAGILGIASIILVAIIAYAPNESLNYDNYTKILFGLILAIPLLSTVAFSIMLISKSEPKRVSTLLKCQLTAVKSGFAITLGLLAFLPLFSTKETESVIVMQDTLFLTLFMCVALSIPFFFSTYLLHVLEEDATA